MFLSLNVSLVVLTNSKKINWIKRFYDIIPDNFDRNQFQKTTRGIYKAIK